MSTNSTYTPITIKYNENFELKLSSEQRKNIVDTDIYRIRFWKAYSVQNCNTDQFALNVDGTFRVTNGPAKYTVISPYKPAPSSSSSSTSSTSSSKSSSKSSKSPSKSGEKSGESSSKSGEKSGESSSKSGEKSGESSSKSSSKSSSTSSSKSGEKSSSKSSSTSSSKSSSTSSSKSSSTSGSVTVKKPVKNVSGYNLWFKVNNANIKDHSGWYILEWKHTDLMTSITRWDVISAYVVSVLPDTFRKDKPLNPLTISKPTTTTTKHDLPRLDSFSYLTLLRDKTYLLSTPGYLSKTTPGLLSSEYRYEWRVSRAELSKEEEDEQVKKYVKDILIKIYDSLQNKRTSIPELPWPKELREEIISGKYGFPRNILAIQSILVSTISDNVGNSIYVVDETKRSLKIINDRLPKYTISADFDEKVMSGSITPNYFKSDIIGTLHDPRDRSYDAILNVMSNPRISSTVKTLGNILNSSSKKQEEFFRKWRIVKGAYDAYENSSSEASSSSTTGPTPEESFIEAMNKQFPSDPSYGSITDAESAYNQKMKDKENMDKDTNTIKEKIDNLEKMKETRNKLIKDVLYKAIRHILKNKRFISLDTFTYDNEVANAAILYDDTALATVNTRVFPKSLQSVYTLVEIDIYNTRNDMKVDTQALILSSPANVLKVHDQDLSATNTVGMQGFNGHGWVRFPLEDPSKNISLSFLETYTNKLIYDRKIQSSSIEKTLDPDKHGSVYTSFSNLNVLRNFDSTGIYLQLFDIQKYVRLKSSKPLIEVDEESLFTYPVLCALFYVFPKSKVVRSYEVNPGETITLDGRPYYDPAKYNVEWLLPNISVDPKLYKINTNATSLGLLVSKNTPVLKIRPTNINTDFGNYTMRVMSKNPSLKYEVIFNITQQLSDVDQDNVDSDQMSIVEQKVLNVFTQYNARVYRWSDQVSSKLFMQLLPHKYEYAMSIAKMIQYYTGKSGYDAFDRFELIDTDLRVKLAMSREFSPPYLRYIPPTNASLERQYILYNPIRGRWEFYQISERVYNAYKKLSQNAPNEFGDNFNLDIDDDTTEFVEALNNYYTSFVVYDDVDRLYARYGFELPDYFRQQDFDLSRRQYPINSLNMLPVVQSESVRNLSIYDWIQSEIILTSLTNTLTQFSSVIDVPLALIGKWLEMLSGNSTSKTPLISSRNIPDFIQTMPIMNRANYASVSQQIKMILDKLQNHYIRYPIDLASEDAHRGTQVSIPIRNAWLPFLSSLPKEFRDKLVLSDSQQLSRLIDRVENTRFSSNSTLANPTRVRIFQMVARGAQLSDNLQYIHDVREVHGTTARVDLTAWRYTVTLRDLVVGNTLSLRRGSDSRLDTLRILNDTLQITITRDPRNAPILERASRLYERTLPIYHELIDNTYVSTRNTVDTIYSNALLVDDTTLINNTTNYMNILVYMDSGNSYLYRDTFNTFINDGQIHDSVKTTIDGSGSKQGRIHGLVENYKSMEQNGFVFYPNNFNQSVFSFDTLSSVLSGQSVTQQGNIPRNLLEPLTRSTRVNILRSFVTPLSSGGGVTLPSGGSGGGSGITLLPSGGSGITLLPSGGSGITLPSGGSGITLPSGGSGLGEMRMPRTITYNFITVTPTVPNLIAFNDQHLINDNAVEMYKLERKKLYEENQEKENKLLASFSNAKSDLKEKSEKYIETINSIAEKFKSSNISVKGSFTSEQLDQIDNSTNLLDETYRKQIKEFLKEFLNADQNTSENITDLKQQDRIVLSEKIEILFSQLGALSKSSDNYQEYLALNDTIAKNKIMLNNYNTVVEKSEVINNTIRKFIDGNVLYDTLVTDSESIVENIKDTKQYIIKILSRNTVESVSIPKSTGKIDHDQAILEAAGMRDYYDLINSNLVKLKNLFDEFEKSLDQLKDHQNKIAGDINFYNTYIKLIPSKNQYVVFSEFITDITTLRDNVKTIIQGALKEDIENARNDAIQYAQQARNYAFTLLIQVSMQDVVEKSEEFNDEEEITNSARKLHKYIFSTKEHKVTFGGSQFYTRMEFIFGSNVTISKMPNIKIDKSVPMYASKVGANYRLISLYRDLDKDEFKSKLKLDTIPDNYNWTVKPTIGSLTHYTVNVMSDTEPDDDDVLYSYNGVIMVKRGTNTRTLLYDTILAIWKSITENSYELMSDFFNYSKTEANIVKQDYSVTMRQIFMYTLDNTFDRLKISLNRVTNEKDVADFINQFKDIKYKKLAPIILLMGVTAQTLSVMADYLYTTGVVIIPSSSSSPIPSSSSSPIPSSSSSPIPSSSSSPIPSSSSSPIPSSSSSPIPPLLISTTTPTSTTAPIPPFLIPTTTPTATLSSSASSSLTSSTSTTPTTPISGIFTASEYSKVSSTYISKPKIISDFLSTVTKYRRERLSKATLTQASSSSPNTSSHQQEVNVTVNAIANLISSQTNNNNNILVDTNLDIMSV